MYLRKLGQLFFCPKPPSGWSDKFRFFFRKRLLVEKPNEFSGARKKEIL
jgi:hypothetical protein